MLAEIVTWPGGRQGVRTLSMRCMKERRWAEVVRWESYGANETNTLTPREGELGVVGSSSLDKFLSVLRSNLLVIMSPMHSVTFPGCGLPPRQRSAQTPKREGPKC